MVGNALPSLTAARSLHAAGYRVIAGDEGESPVVARSRACHEVWPHPPIRQEEEFLVALTTFLAARPDITTLLPLQERYVAVLASARDRLPDALVMASPDPTTVLTCLDKDRMYDVARAAGVPFRPVAVVSDLAELADAARATGYPNVIRPASGASQLLPGDRKAVIAGDPVELERAFPHWPDAHRTLIVQHYVDGPRHNVYFAAHRGRILARVEAVILRTDNPNGTGFATEGITVAPSSRLQTACDAIVDRLDYTGIGCAQFLVPPDGEMSFLELNPRHGGNSAMVTACGLDLTLAAIGLASHENGWRPEQDFSYPIGRRYAWSTRQFYAVLKARSGGTLSRRAMARQLARVVTTAARADAHMTWSFRDPGPTRAILTRTIRNHLRGRVDSRSRARSDSP